MSHASSVPFDPSRIALVGFGDVEFATFRAAGLDIRLWVRRPQETGTVPADGVTLVAFDDVKRARLCAYRADLPPSLRAAVRRAGFERFRRSLSRISQDEPPSPWSWLDGENKFHQTLHWAYDALCRHGIGTVIFRNVPHQGAVPILYDLAKALGLRTLLSMQTILPDRLALIRDVEDFGHFATTRGAGLPPPVPLPEEPTTPFYMASVPQRRRVAALRRYATELAKFTGKNLSLWPLVHRRAFQKNRRRLASAQARFWHEWSAASRYDSFDPARDATRPFIYLPLHLQPEMTTDLLGGAYADQLLMLEDLLSGLPEGMELLVKENPKQKPFMREPSFFQRLKSLPRVRFLPPTVPSFALIRAARAVATVTGTAGWEAVTVGRPVILFGLGWYRRMPGVFPWQGPETVARALAWQPDRAAAEAAYAEICRGLYPGMTDPDYAALLPDGDVEAALKRGARSILAALHEHEAPLAPGDAAAAPHEASGRAEPSLSAASPV